MKRRDIITILEYELLMARQLERLHESTGHERAQYWNRGKAAGLQLALDCLRGDGLKGKK